MTMSKKHVAAGEDQSAILDGSKINVAANAFKSLPIWNNFAVDSQARHSAIGINLETQMRKTLFTLHRKRVLRVARERELWQELGPRDGSVG